MAPAGISAGVIIQGGLQSTPQLEPVRLSVNSAHIYGGPTVTVSFSSFPVNRNGTL